MVGGVRIDNGCDDGDVQTMPGVNEFPLSAYVSPDGAGLQSFIRSSSGKLANSSQPDLSSIIEVERRV